MAAKKKSAAKKSVSKLPTENTLSGIPAAEPVTPARTPVRKPRAKKVKTFAYATLSDGAVGTISCAYESEQAMFDDISLSLSKNTDIVMYREIKRGAVKVKTKVTIG